jgi:hypothetical protein
MAAGRSSLLASWLGFLLLVGAFLSFAKDSSAATSQDSQYVQYTNSDGQVVWLADNRRPALYTQSFGDCMGDSLINVTRFDAAYYKDNMTVLFHLAGISALTNQSLMRTLPRSCTARGLWLTSQSSSLHRCLCLRKTAFRIDLQPLQRQHQQLMPLEFEYPH